MDARELNEICRLCPSSGGGEDLMYVFDERLSVKNNMKEVILVTTGVEIQETDLISKKICHRCCNKTLQMFLFRQDALTQDRALKEKCSRFLEDKGIRLPNTCITIKRERRDSLPILKRQKEELDDMPPPATKVKRKKTIHPSVIDVYKTYPFIKLPKKCLERHLAPVVSFTMGAVENYFKEHKLDMKDFIYKPGTKKPPFRAVAKKRTSYPTKQKTVSPIKISKKVLENYEVHTGANINYVCTSVHKERKKSVSPSDADKPLQSKRPLESKAVKSKSPAKIIETPRHPKISNENIPDSQVPILQPPLLVPHVPETAETIKPTATTPASEDTRESFSSGASKPEFIESLGLTPTVTATKSQTLHVCNLCGSVHNNAFKLKTHMRKHMVCQFCKLRFKSLETKQDHVDNSCQVKEIINSSGPVVELQKIHLNIAIRKKFKDAFADFDLISGLTELDSTDQLTDEIELSLQQLKSGNDNHVSNEEQDQTKSSTSLKSTMPPVKLTTDSENASTSVVKPDVRIKNNILIDNLVGDIDDKQLVKNLVCLLKPKRPRTIEKVLQTDLPATKDIKINNAEGFCEFKKLKEQLLSYQIPVSITNGPFHVAYQYKNNSSSTPNLALWSDLSVIDVYKKSKPNTSTSSVLTNFTIGEGTSMNYQIQSTHISSSVPLTKVNPGLASRNSSPASTSVGGTVANHTVDANTSSSVTPLLQNFGQMTSSLGAGKSTPTPKIFVTPARGYSANTSRRSLSLKMKNINNRSVLSTLSRKSLPPNISSNRKSKSSVVTNGTNSSVTVSTAATSAELQATSALETSKFRVKNVWELQ